MSTIRHPPPLTPAHRIAAPPPPRSPRASGPSLVYAGWGVRAGALFIDWLIAFAASAVFYIIGFALLASPSTMQVGVFLLLATYVLGPLVGFAFYAWQMCRSGERNGQTIGKTTLKIRVVRADGRPVGFGTVLMRHVVIGLFYVVTLGVGIIVDYLWPLWDERNQTLHDKIAGTYVTRTEHHVGAPRPAVPRPVNSISASPGARPSVLATPAGPPGDVPVVAAHALAASLPPVRAQVPPARPSAPATRPEPSGDQLTASTGAIATTASYCAACGHAAGPADRFCLHCGTQLMPAPPPHAPAPAATAIPAVPVAAAGRAAPRVVALLAGAVTLVAVVIALVAVLGAGRAAPAQSVAAYFPASNGQATPVAEPTQPAADSDVDPPATPPPAPAPAPAPTRDDGPRPTGGRDAAVAVSSPRSGTAAGPETTLRRHFERLDDGDFEAAFALMTPAYRASSPQWPAVRRQAAPAVRIDAIELAHLGGDNADVTITFYARDAYKVRGSDTACRRFSGSAHLRRIDGLWRYDPLANNLSVAILPPTNSRCP